MIVLIMFQLTIERIKKKNNMYFGIKNNNILTNIISIPYSDTIV